MGADIHAFAEVRKDGKWIRNYNKIFPGWNELVDEPFSWRDYSVFGFLADVRNYSESEVIAPPKGLPDDSEFLLNAKDRYGDPEIDHIVDMDNHSYSWLTLRELLDFDYDKKFNDQRRKREITYREFLMGGFFEQIEALKTLGDPDDVRIVFWFDN